VDVHVDGTFGAGNRSGGLMPCFSIAQLRDAVLGKGVTAKDTGKHVQEVRSPHPPAALPFRTGALRHIGARHVARAHTLPPRPH